MNIHIINNETIHTEYDYDLHCLGYPAWTATFDDYDGAPIDHETPSDDPIGEGHTEQEAIKDLLEKDL